MSTLAIALIAFGFIFGGMLVGMFLRQYFPNITSVMSQRMLRNWG